MCFSNFTFATYILAPEHLIFKIIVPSFHNKPLIMGGRHKNFKDQMHWSQDVTKTRCKHIFAAGPFIANTIYNISMLN
jgi:hypothetical protein